MKKKSERLFYYSLISISIVLYLPVIYLAWNTPFALIDDLTDWTNIMIFDSSSSFLNWLRYNLYEVPRYRWRPLFELNAAVTWKFFGLNYEIHHLWRLVLRILTAFFLARTIQAFIEEKRERLWIGTIAFFVILFFPNNPEARLAPQELLLIFFFSLAMLGCTKYFYTLSSKGSRSITWFTLILLAVGGMLTSKEVAIVLVPSILIFILFGPSRSLAAKVSLIVPVFLFSIWAYFRIEALDNPAATNVGQLSMEYLHGHWHLLMQYVFDPFNFRFSMKLYRITFFLLFVIVYWNLIKSKNFRRPDIYLVTSFLTAWVLALVATLHLPLGCMRYSYPNAILTVTTFFLLIAFLVNSKRLRVPPWVWVACLCGYYVFSYKNLLYQFKNQYDARNMEHHLITEISRQQQNGKRVWVESAGEFSDKLITRFDGFAKRYEIPGKPLLHSVSVQELGESLRAGDLVVRLGKTDAGKNEIYQSPAQPNFAPFQIAEKIHRLATFSQGGGGHNDCAGGAYGQWVIFEE